MRVRACVRLPPPSPRRLRRGKMGTDVGVLYGPLGGRSRHKQGHKRSRERAVAAPSSIAVLKPHLRYLLVSDTHAVTSDTRPHYEPTTASQNRQVISNPNDGVTGERRDKKRSYKLTIARCTPTMRGAPPCRAKGRSAGATTRPQTTAPTLCQQPPDAHSSSAC